MANPSVKRAEDASENARACFCVRLNQRCEKNRVKRNGDKALEAERDAVGLVSASERG